mgnify:CR=1 FL=1
MLKGPSESQTLSFDNITTVGAGLERVKTELALLQQEIQESIQLATDIKLWVQLNIPRIEDGNNFGVSIQEGMVQELSRAEDAGMGALEGLGRWWQGRAKLISKVIKYAQVLHCSSQAEALDAGLQASILDAGLQAQAPAQALAPPQAQAQAQAHAHAHTHPRAHPHHKPCSQCHFSSHDPHVFALLEGDRRFLGNIWMGWCDLRNNYAVLYDLLAKNIEKIILPRSDNASNMY